ncbi:MAG: hypothetical protein V3V47_03375, partial [Desulfobacteria bacterium]
RVQNEGSPCALVSYCLTLCALPKVSPIALCRMKSREREDNVGMHLVSRHLQGFCKTHAYACTTLTFLSMNKFDLSEKYWKRLRKVT